MEFRRYMCSHLVNLRRGAKESVVNLEEIWETGAALESEEPVEKGTRAEIRAEGAFFAGDITQVEQHDFGWRFQMHFSPLTPWRPEAFRPEHLLEIEVGGKPTESR